MNIILVFIMAFIAGAAWLTSIVLFMMDRGVIRGITFGNGKAYTFNCKELVVEIPEEEDCF